MTTVTGTNGTHGTNGVHPGTGGNGTDATYTLNGTIGTPPFTLTVTGGKGGAGGNKTGAGAGMNGGNGGNGGNASATLNGNIFNNAPTTSMVISATSKGGDGGLGGTTNSGIGFGPGMTGNGGNGSVTMNGNILQPNKTMTNMELDGFAIGGQGTKDGNATSTMQGNIIQGTSTTASINATATVAGDDTSHDGDAAFGTKLTNVNGNIVSGKINTVTLNSNWSPTANYSNSTADLNGNIVSTTSATSGSVTLEAAGQHIDIEQNKVNLGGTQSMNLIITEMAPAFDATIKGNDFEGTGTSAFVFTDNGMPGTSLTPDTVVIDLGNNSFMFDGKNNKLKGFNNVTVNGNNVNTTWTGTAGNDILTGGAGNDLFIATTGADTYNGGGGVNTVSYINGLGPNGVTVNLSLQPAPQPIGGGFGPDTLINIQNVIGTNFNDVLTGDANANVLSGGMGNDLLFATAGGDTLDGGAGTDTANFSLDTGTGVTVDLNVQGTSQNVGGSIGPITLISIENVVGSAFNDTLIAGLAGPETLDGGSAGSDTADFRHGTSGVTVDLNTPGAAQAVGGGFGAITLNNISNVTGSAFDDTLIAGLGGAETLDGGSAGSDTASFIHGTGGVTVDLFTQGTPETVGGGFGAITLNNISNVTGTAFDDTLIAGTGVETLNGGANTAVGDTADFRHATSGVNVAIIGTQQDLTSSGLGKITLQNIENLTGSAFDDTLTAGAGPATLTGGAGNDILNGNGVNTTANFSDSAAGVTANLLSGTATGDGNDTLNAISNLAGSNFNDLLIGDGNANILSGGAGNDILWGGLGNDTLNGGAGTDTAYFSGRETQYGTHTLTSVIGPDGTDTLSGIERLKFLSPTHVSDVDNNGTGDLVFQNNANFNLQVRTLAPNATLPAIAVATNWHAVGTGQFTADSDRLAGILLQNTTNQHLEVITSVNSTPVTTALSANPGAGWTAISAGDFDGDGASDVLLQQGAGGPVKIMFLAGGGASGAIGTVLGTSASIASPGAGWNAIASGDFNGDGKSDILWQNTTTDQVEVFLMNGGTVATAGPALSPAPTFTAVGTGDFNGDGNSDILFRDTATNSAVIWTMNGTGQSGPAITVLQPAANFVVMGAEDVDGNGSSDILWQDPTTGNVKVTPFTAGVPSPTINLGAPASTFHLVASTGGG